jgi:hypothetical protein
MSNESPDLDNNRSRSIFRHVRETFGSIGRHKQRAETRAESPPLTLINTKCESADNIDRKNLQTKVNLKKTTPISFSHHLSLLNQFKSHINKTRKYQQTTQLSLDNDAYTPLSLPPMPYSPVSYVNTDHESYIGISWYT